MLRSLSIQNFALLRRINLEFTAGFTALTGETGAGKSILLNALGLIRGDRADTTALYDKEEKCIVEAEFDIEKYQLQDFFETHDLDYDPLTIVRREILPNGKSRAFVNDAPVLVNTLQLLAAELIDIHGQQDTRNLSDKLYQIAFLDAFAQTTHQLQLFQTQLKAHQKLLKQIADKERELFEAQKAKDYNTFLFEELQALQLQDGDQAIWEGELNKLENAETIKEALAFSKYSIDDTEFSVASQLNQIQAKLKRIADFHPDYQDFHDRIASMLIDVRELDKELSAQIDAIEANPAEKESLQEKVDTLYQLFRKHQVSSDADLIDVRNQLEAQISAIENNQEELELWKKTANEQRAALQQVAQTLSEARKKAAPKLETELAMLTKELGMPHAKFALTFQQTTDFTATGIDDVEIVFSANPGTDLQALRKSASGGELSRIMLVIKSILAKHSKLPTLIFDEIDTGVSGEIAYKMSEIMRGMASDMQLFAITHLPQVAAAANEHFRVSKAVNGTETETKVLRLDLEERISEIASMISGSTASAAAIEHARSLLHRTSS
ncbi:DNA repair protein RecN [Flavobacterium sp.]|uniref:DNA repair protein RecN n=1 Tax=Flavobacterium sp. TaxID=239 RepID=UPI00260C38B4|nr:DNA repair protein RecN [Flavobacterium sp.]